ncbi:carbohydrate ABC transporter permease [Paenibacillus sp. sgz302251]|uniref:carbohydrate ABC transporter permease n=1 Tax=Paenibacillus sp. sgz302251 TaxID=3414493 RepID=UPI003C7B39BF
MNKRSRLSMKGRRILEGYTFISLWVLGFLLFMAIPLGRSLYYSFNQLVTSKTGLQATYVGFDQFRKAFTADVNFLPALQGTIVNMITQVPLILVFAMFSALLLNRPMIGRTFFRGVFFLPVIIASGAILQELLDQGADRLPIFNQPDLIFTLRTIVPPDVLEPLLQTADNLTLVMWHSGVQILIFLAGLQTISTSLYEAAEIDGATKWEAFWKITFPMIIPMILVNTLFSVVSSFTEVNNQMMQYIRNVVFSQNDYGYGSAIGWIYFVVIFIIIGIVFTLFRRGLENSEDRR